MATDIPAPLYIPRLGHQDIADTALAQNLYRRGNVHVGPHVGAVLDHDIISTRRVQQQAAFPQVVRARLFDVNVFAGIAGQDRGGSVPMIGRGDHHRIYRFVV